MVDPNELEDVDNESTKETEPTKAETAKKANKTVTEEANEFRERKEKADEEIKKIKAEKKKAEKKAKKKAQQESIKEKNSESMEKEEPQNKPTSEEPKETPTKVKTPKPVKADDFNARGNTVKLEQFIEKITKDFNLTSEPDKGDCCQLKFDDFLVCKILPRANCWYGVWREDPDDNNKWRAFRVYGEEEEKETYEHIKEFVRVNAETNDKPKE